MLLRRAQPADSIDHCLPAHAFFMCCCGSPSPRACCAGCLAWCSYDGIHANAAVYALVNQMIANLLKLPPDVDRFDDHSAPGSAVAVGSAKPVGTAAKTTAPGPSRPLKKSQAVAVNLQQIAAKRAMSKQGLQAGAKQPR